MSNFSPAYHRALKEAKEHHESSKTYSGKFLRPHAPAIKKMIEEYGVKSILDYGCGKARQYEWVSHGEDASIPAGETLESYWGMNVAKWDPAYQPLKARPVGPFDMVICTHVLGSIPLTDFARVVHDLQDYATKVIYVAEKIGPVRKQVFTDPALFPRWGGEQWIRELHDAAAPRTFGPTIWLATREKIPGEGVYTSLKQVFP